MDRHDALFARIETSLKALDTHADAYIRALDERLQRLGVAVEVYLDKPVDAWRAAEPGIEMSLLPGYARHAGRFALSLKTIKRLAANAPGGTETVDARVEPLRDAAQASRVAVVDKLPEVLLAIEAELTRRAARLAGNANGETAAPQPQAKRVEAPVHAPAVAAAKEPPRAAAPTAKPTSREVSVPPAAEVDVPLKPGSNPGSKPGSAPDSVDHMFRLFGRKDK